MSTAPQSHPLEIPRLVITPSTPTDDVPIAEGRLRLTPPRTQPLFLTSDRPQPRPLNKIRPSTAVRPRSHSSSSALNKSHNAKTYGCAPRIQSFPLERTPSRSNSRTRLRRSVDEGPLPLHGRGTAASLVLITAGFLLVMTSILLSPETIVRLIGQQKKWAGDARKSLVALMDVDHGHEYGHDHARVPTDRGLVIDSYTRREDGRQGVSETMLDVEAQVTAGPVMSHEAWKTYLKRRRQVMGGAGPTAHIEAWDFH